MASHTEETGFVIARGAARGPDWLTRVVVKALNRAARAARKPANVVGFRALQAGRLAALRVTRSWPRIERRVRAFWSDARAGHRQTEWWKLRIIAPDAIAAARARVGADPVFAASVAGMGAARAARNFRLLNAPVPVNGAWPWHDDWRVGHRWAPAYFGTYETHEARLVPYDIKYPWELSRLGFLIPPLQAELIAGSPTAGEWCANVVRDWERNNPVAYSCNWFPLEASVRVMNLVVMLEMLQAADARNDDRLAPLARQLTLNAEFLWQTIEYTDVRGNHYLANLVALLLAGAKLSGAWPAAPRWAAYARRNLAPELELQFHPDGSYFDQSVAYQRFVCELVLLAGVCERRSMRDTSAMDGTLARASRYLAAVRRPDGLAPNVGDNDSATLLQFDPCSPRDHRPLLATVAALLGDGLCRNASTAPALATSWLLGLEGTLAWQETPREPLPPYIRFPDAGNVVVHHGDDYVFFDGGSIGKHGRAGHGHNDLMSFELAFSSTPVVIDTGCPTYTADVPLRNASRGTAAHNGLMIDRTEIVELNGVFGVGAEVKPAPPTVQVDERGITISAEHHNYQRLPDPVLHQRTLRFNCSQRSLEVEDSLSCARSHRVERFLHFAPGVQVQLSATGAAVRAGTHTVEATWRGGADTQAVISRGMVSAGYGDRNDGQVLTLINCIEGPVTLSLQLTYSAEPT